MRVPFLLFTMFVAFIFLVSFKLKDVHEETNKEFQICYNKCKPNAVYHADKDFCVCDLTKVTK